MIDRHDRALLSKYVEHAFEFTSTDAQEVRTLKLFELGLLARRWEGDPRGGAYRWSYRRTPAGTAAIAP